LLWLVENPERAKGNCTSPMAPSPLPSLNVGSTAVLDGTGYQWRNLPLEEAHLGGEGKMGGDLAKSRYR
jgi:hypothetical protein